MKLYTNLVKSINQIIKTSEKSVGGRGEACKLLSTAFWVCCGCVVKPKLSREASQEASARRQGKSMKRYENLWKSMKSHENRWQSMKIYENLRKSTKNQQKTTKINDNQLNSIEINEILH